MSERSKTAAIGIDLGGTKLLGAVVNESGKILTERTRPTDAPRGTDAVIDAIADITRELAADAARAGVALKGVGVGAPGPLDPATGVVYAMPNLGDGWNRFPLRSRLEAALETRVHVENDANAALQGEAWVGAAAGASDAALLTLGTGVGGGIIAAGNLVRGSRGVGAELGHIVVAEPSDVACGCGGRGCLEQFASGTAVGRLAAEAIARGRGGALAALEREPTARDVISSARDGDEVAREVLERSGRALGVGLVTIVHALNPQVIVLGGGLGTAGFDLLAPIAERELRSRTFKASLEGLKIARAALGPEAGAVGAARSVLLGD
jgi:glucokinase